jgi:hypothetical protein
MRNHLRTLKLATIFGLTTAMVAASASTASAGLFKRKVIVVPSSTVVVPAQTTIIREAAPVVVSEPVETVYEAPARVLVPSRVYPPVVERRYIQSVDEMVVPTTYVPTTVIREVYPRRTKVVVPRRVYRYYGY